MLSRSPNIIIYITAIVFARSICSHLASTDIASQKTLVCRQADEYKLGCKQNLEKT